LAFEGRTHSVLSLLKREGPELLSKMSTIPNCLYSASSILHFACRGDHRHLAFELIKEGADPLLRNEVGDTALTYCVPSFRSQIMSLRNKYLSNH